VAELRVAHTAELDAATRSAIRALMDECFGVVSDDTFENALGGMHAMLFAGAELVGHGSVVQRRLLHAGKSLRTGYVEGVAVRADHRRHGYGGTVMAALERIVRAGYQLGGLRASADGARLYVARGWQLWEGPSSAFTPDGIRPTPERDGLIYVLRVRMPVDVTGGLTCDWRNGAVW
jgi:aminoglycoside 2'-N-acetyltransferase I